MKGKIFDICSYVDHILLFNKIDKIIADQPLKDLIYKILKSESIDNNLKTGLWKKGFLTPMLINIFLHDFDCHMLNLIKKFNFHNNSNLNFLSYIRFNDNFIIGAK